MMCRAVLCRAMPGLARLLLNRRHTPTTPTRKRKWQAYRERHGIATRAARRLEFKRGAFPRYYYRFILLKDRGTGVCAM